METKSNFIKLILRKKEHIIRRKILNAFLIYRPIGANLITGNPMGIFLRIFLQYQVSREEYYKLSHSPFRSGTFDS